jgi:hypothetical protein
LSRFAPSRIATTRQCISETLVLDSIYAGQQGVTVHVVRPADLTSLEGVGGGMDNWAEYLVKAIRERDASAVALFSYWPDNPYDVIRRVVFTRADERLSIFDEIVRRLSPHRRRELPRYGRRNLYHYSFDDVSNMLGTHLARETPTEVAARANRLSDWAMLKSEVRRANDE